MLGPACVTLASQIIILPPPPPPVPENWALQENPPHKTLLFTGFLGSVVIYILVASLGRAQGQ